jgi:isoleucyl-tRNA synthetase
MAERAKMFEEAGKSDAAKREEEVLAFWEEQRIFEKSLEQDAPNGEFVFYDGPPFATGLPHAGHFLASTSKDVIPRYKTMRGYSVRRRWGWDTHGLPIESVVEKKLGLKNKKEILELGIEKFNETARSLVLEYVHDWKKYVGRLGRWVDFDNSYKTMDATFMESVWWGLKQINDKGHLYEGRKVLMYCPHCETPLAKAEIAMDNTYKDVTDEAATVKFKVKDPAKNGLPENTFLLAWTTTPWTLPGNVALAVGSTIQYGLYEKDSEYFVLAKDLAEKNGLTNLVSEISGTALVGAEYEPLFTISKVTAYEGKKWVVLPADFVTAEDGTGIVHTAVIYGEDDYALGLKEGLPMFPMLDPNGTYNSDAPEFLHGQYFKKGEAIIKSDLESRGLLFAKAPYTHSYPHCYRCGTALIYNAVSSWFINIQAIKDRMLAENENITWAPEHLKHGRFRHNVDTAPDWTISRNRFWATPLPIWKDKAGKVRVIGSVEELKSLTKKSGNTYLVMRHGTTDNNVKKIVTSTRDSAVGLNETGRGEVVASTQKLLSEKITQIYASPFLRTQESAQIVAEALGLPKDAVITDDRLSEFNFGELNEQPLQKFFDFHESHAYDERVPGGESYQDAKKRFGEFLYEIETKHQNEKILIVTHGIAFETLNAVVKGLDKKASRELIHVTNPNRGEVIALDFVPLPHNAEYELDLHLPYIDRVQLVDEQGDALVRIPEVIDCWVESGSMPFAEYHYPFENKELFEKRSPGDFVSEYIAQTRAWFYYMHALSVGLFDHAAFRNVVTTGTILAADGEKVSKSKQNYTDPYVLFDRFSADAFRFYLMSSVLMLAEDLSFKDDELKEIQNRVINTLHNVLAFYSLFKDEVTNEEMGPSTNVLDAWIRSRLAEVIQNATTTFDAYDVAHATRPMREFIDDLSTWYVRRSRDRVKGSDALDKQHALVTLRYVLKEFSTCIAPVMPFIAEEIFQVVKTEQDPESVHLCVWPATDTSALNQKLSEDMNRVRAIASEALMLRQKSGIKVRQPLASLSIVGELAPELAEIVKDELNVKEIIRGATEMSLDTVLTPALIREGDVREFVRALSEARKEQGLTQKDLVMVTASEQAKSVLETVSVPGVSEIRFSVDELTGAVYTAVLSFDTISFTITPNAA